MSPEPLDQAVCVLTGASGGIGSALADELVGRGARLILAGRDEPALSRLLASLPSGAVVDVCVGDLLAHDARLALCETASRHRARVLINLFGRNDLTLFGEQTQASVADLIQTNLHAPIELTRLMLPGLMALPSARIVNVGSVFGAIGHPGYAVYCATKFGLRGFSEALARELSDSSVRVIHVAPRATRTPMNDAVADTLNEALGTTVDEPGRVAAAIADALVSERRSTTVGPAERLFSWINAIAPGLVDRSIRAKLPTIKGIVGRNRIISTKEIHHVEV